MQNAFDPPEIELFSKVIDDACRRLGCDDALKAMVAARVLSYADQGMRDYETLLAIAMARKETSKGNDAPCSGDIGMSSRRVTQP